MSVLAPLPQRTLRNSDLRTLVGVLKDQHAAKVDLVVPTNSIRLDAGRRTQRRKERQAVARELRS